MNNSLNQVTDKTQIAAVLRAYMLRPTEQRAPFLVEIKQRGGSEWNGTTMGAGGHIIEGARPTSACSDADDTTFHLTNGDSNYTRVIGSVKLSDIEYISTLPRR